MAGTKIILGFIAGASIGAIAGILLAPEKGSDTRKKIIEKSGDLRDAVKECINGFVKEVKDTGIAAPEEPAAVPKMNLNTMG